MGDRANIVMKQDGGKASEIFFYTHWAGTELPETLQAALIRGKDRWTDEPYLGRIIFAEMIKDRPLELTGYGISTYLCDNSYDLLVVDVEKQTVVRRTEKGVEKQSWPFSEYITLDLARFWGNGEDDD